MENQTKINIHYCRFCDGVCEESFDDVKPPHYAKAWCYKCQKSSGWIPKPKNEDKRKPSLKLRKLIPIDLQDVCEICLRNENTLKKLDIGFQVHHAIPFKEKGADTKENLRLLCTHCHQLVERQRKLYIRYEGFLK